MGCDTEVRLLWQVRWPLWDTGLMEDVGELFLTHKQGSDGKLRHIGTLVWVATLRCQLINGADLTSWAASRTLLHPLNRYVAPPWSD